LVFFVGLSPPGTFENLPELPIVAVWRRRWRPWTFVIPEAGRVRTFSTSSSWWLSQCGQWLLNRRGISMDIDLSRKKQVPVETRFVSRRADVLTIGDRGVEVSGIGTGLEAFNLRSDDFRS